MEEKTKNLLTPLIEELFTKDVKYGKFICYQVDYDRIKFAERGQDRYVGLYWDQDNRNDCMIEITVSGIDGEQKYKSLEEGFDKLLEILKITENDLREIFINFKKRKRRIK